MHVLVTGATGYVGGRLSTPSWRKPRRGPQRGDKQAALALADGAAFARGCLVPRLLEAGHRVRVPVWDPSRLEGRPWTERVEVVPGSLEDPTALRQALSGVEAAYYLVHAMLSEEDFPQAEERQARTFAHVARGSSGPLLFGLQTPLGKRVSFQACEL
ncbi:NAD(P)H-binding protein [Thermus caliditerrae]|uniref:NAD(P)H-binding protein n=1 Tax=Thermus caliditerrae TaxID=1330700 RepID=UPI0012695480|nr:NAD(P)H-binding protein [Thermus caliditerrae]